MKVDTMGWAELKAELVLPVRTASEGWSRGKGASRKGKTWINCAKSCFEKPCLLSGWVHVGRAGKMLKGDEPASWKGTWVSLPLQGCQCLRGGLCCWLPSLCWFVHICGSDTHPLAKTVFASPVKLLQRKTVSSAFQTGHQRLNRITQQQLTGTQSLQTDCSKQSLRKYYWNSRSFQVSAHFSLA